jgi:hypothetical protein
MPIRPLAVTATLGLPVAPPAKDLKVPQRVVADQDDIRPTPAVAPIGTATRHMRLTAKRDRPVPAGAGLYEYARAILEHDVNDGDGAHLRSL